MTLSKLEYYTEIESIAEDLVKEAMEASGNDREEAQKLINDSLLHEMIDGHHWIIYYAYNLDVLAASDDNEDAFINAFGCEAAANILTNKGLQDLHQALAYWTMLADVQDALSDALDAYEAKREQDELLARVEASSPLEA